MQLWDFFAFRPKVSRTPGSGFSTMANHTNRHTTRQTDIPDSRRNYTLCTVHYVFRSILALHSFRLKLCSVKYLVQCSKVSLECLCCVCVHRNVVNRPGVAGAVLHTHDCAQRNVLKMVWKQINVLTLCQIKHKKIVCFASFALTSLSLHRF